ncbi:hypothetical protein POL67_19860 [Polyangium sp. rjm3]|uniref:Uncharacterized protein n=1 Tax=Polyangium mundeleinium TaxID=2995306 RepID=A0ABT5EP28_9BACT|nr:hypothetical protein [Polyangium mundeleinium]MDC0743593.1 hypothetical protein [Polyangium mundeleinium]
MVVVLDLDNGDGEVRLVEKDDVRALAGVGDPVLACATLRGDAVGGEGELLADLAIEVPAGGRSRVAKYV